ncbi:site-specific integrase [Sinorhizobium fredii]|uniref:site-specific integrase n=1 Tax=Rhizobium fredii TaxID=380 RepID=UPI0005688450|nr:site-specific integrase [Sinorhizobium fredii]
MYREKALTLKNAVLADFQWHDAEGNTLTKLPFKVPHRIGQGSFMSDAWPPKNWSTFRTLIPVVQVTNVAVLAFCTGGRHHEVAGMVNSNVQLDDELIRGRTYKYSRRLGGIEREWPLHEIAARAVGIQDRLAAVIRPEGTDHLWVQVMPSKGGPRGAPLADLSELSHDTLKRIELMDPEEGRAHLHRWRHTIARLIGITVDDAQEVLQDLFGHNNVENVLIYLLSNAELAAEAIQVGEEAAFVLAQDALKEVMAGKAGGPAAQRIFVAMEDYRMQRGIKAFGTDDIEEAAMLLNLEGTAAARQPR